MATFNAAFTLPADKLDTARSFARELNGPRRTQLEEPRTALRRRT